ncbi:hypothetical protein BDK51DRAFT_45414 [Blyttiomyces helicus]|uniref:Uncharacterized protein n=1 Tax=Blyttiomyces helicus TaxID=388810 RepID=A0A4P9WMI4_9FUNG|nr:hypothetical protein BDK51DRAFT_45414 [Blyttiomyces helicus]|eukprot:RKO93692.1 hypothetical protein BDK51DRAFT_45414 [Blyttiomyces helicus]
MRHNEPTAADISETPDEIKVTMFRSKVDVKKFHKVLALLQECDEKTMSEEDMFVALNKLTLELYSDVIVDKLPNTILALAVMSPPTPFASRTALISASPGLA